MRPSITSTSVSPCAPEAGRASGATAASARPASSRLSISEIGIMRGASGPPVEMGVRDPAGAQAGQARADGAAVAVRQLLVLELPGAGVVAQPRDVDLVPGDLE